MQSLASHLPLAAESTAYVVPWLEPPGTGTMGNQAL
jgi:hypothetical protein